jgi:hypothetical protein
MVLSGYFQLLAIEEFIVSIPLQATITLQTKLYDLVFLAFNAFKVYIDILIS